MFFWKKKKKKEPERIQYSYDDVASYLRSRIVSDDGLKNPEFPDDSLLMNDLGLDSLDFIILGHDVYFHFGVDADIEKEGFSFMDIRFDQYVNIILKHLNDKKL